jgi:exopolysaccharide production protein ExoQ
MSLEIARIPTRLERLYFAVALFLLAGALPIFIGAQVPSTPGRDGIAKPAWVMSDADVLAISADGDPTKQLVFLGFYAAGLALLLSHARASSLLFLGVPLILLLAWCFASAGWSGMPVGTVRRATALLGTILIGAYAGLRLRWTDMLRLLSYVTVATLLGSLTVAAVAPSLGLDFEGRLRGFFPDKNALGSYTALALLAVLARLPESKGLCARAGDVILCLLCLPCLVSAHSATQVPTLGVALVLLLATRAARGGHTWLFALVPLACSATIVSLLVVPSEIGQWTDLLGRDADLSGRTLIWRFVLAKIAEQPLLGYGYGVFWIGSQAPGAEFWKVAHQALLHAHNGYLQLLLDVGTIGTGLFAAAFFTLVGRLGWLVRYGDDPQVAWIVALLGFFVVGNVAEARALVGNDALTALFVYMVVSTNVAIARHVSTSPKSTITTPVSGFSSPWREA